MRQSTIALAAAMAVAFTTPLAAQAPASRLKVYCFGAIAATRPAVSACLPTGTPAKIVGGACPATCQDVKH